MILKRPVTGEPWGRAAEGRRSPGRWRELLSANLPLPLDASGLDVKIIP